jgi:hypothetical protein
MRDAIAFVNHTVGMTVFQSHIADERPPLCLSGSRSELWRYPPIGAACAGVRRIRSRNPSAVECQQEGNI